MTKATKNDIINVIRIMAEAQDADAIFENGVTTADIISYCDTTLAQAEARKVKAAEKRNAKAAEADEMKTSIVAMLADEARAMTREEIFDAIEHDEDFTIAKLGAKLTALIKEGSIVKSETRIDKRTKMVYSVAVADESVEE